MSIQSKHKSEIHAQPSQITTTEDIVTPLLSTASPTYTTRQLSSRTYAAGRGYHHFLLGYTHRSTNSNTYKNIAQALSVPIIWSMLTAVKGAQRYAAASAGFRQFVGWLFNVPATCECISGTDLLRQFYVLSHWDRSCRPHFPSRPVTVYRHWADQSQRWPYNARCLAG